MFDNQHFYAVIIIYNFFWGKSFKLCRIILIPQFIYGFKIHLHYEAYFTRMAKRTIFIEKSALVEIPHIFLKPITGLNFSHLYPHQIPFPQIPSVSIDCSFTKMLAKLSFTNWTCCLGALPTSLPKAETGDSALQHVPALGHMLVPWSLYEGSTSGPLVVMSSCHCWLLDPEKTPPLESQ